MSLDAGSVSRAVEPVVESGTISVRREVFEPWTDWEPSRISHHGRECCEIAREWLIGIDCSALNGANSLSGPRWLRRMFEWGPSRYPMYWCEAVKKKRLDCGVLAALAHEIFLSRGVRSYRTQLVQEFSTSAGDQWLEAWHSGSGVTAWINDDLIYHEGCAIAPADNELKMWDSSAGWWMDPKTTSGYGSVLAVRIAATGGEFRWGPHILLAGDWTPLA